MSSIAEVVYTTMFAVGMILYGAFLILLLKKGSKCDGRAGDEFGVYLSLNIEDLGQRILCILSSVLVHFLPLRVG